jgi:hypothetical protein
MKNYAGQLPAEAGKDFKTLMDRENNPLICAIGSDQRLRLICQNDDGSAPWQLTSLTADPVHGFAVAQNPDSGEIRVAYATFDGHESRLFYSFPFANDRATLKPDRRFEWERYELQSARVEINRIEIDFEHIMFSTRDSSGQVASYYAGPLAAGKATRFELPEYAKEIIDFKVGSYPLELDGSARGTYLLYENKDKVQTLLFQGFPEADGWVTTESFSIPLVPNGAGDRGGSAAADTQSRCRLNSIDLIRKRKGGDQLLACEGLRALGWGQTFVFRL